MTEVSRAKFAGACREAIVKIFPQNLHQEAFKVLELENGKEDPRRVGVNKDKERSRDHGCMQINDYWHLDRPGTGWTRLTDIYEPDFNVQQAKRIYERRGDTWQAFYSVCTKGKEVFPKERCGR